MIDHRLEAARILDEIAMSGWTEVRPLYYHLLELSSGAGIDDDLLSSFLKAIECVVEKPMRVRVLVQTILDVAKHLSPVQRSKILSVVDSNVRLQRLEIIGDLRRALS